MKRRVLALVVWLAVVALLLARLGQLRQGLAFGGAVLSVLAAGALVSYLVGAKAPVSVMLPAEISRNAAVPARVKGAALLGLVPHRFVLAEGADHLSLQDKRDGFNFIFARRGLYRQVPLRLVWQDPLGFFVWQKEVPLQEQLWVYPRVGRAKLPALKAGFNEEYLVEGGAWGEGRRIHWGATARTGNLVMRSFRRRNGLWLLVFFQGDTMDDSIADAAAAYWHTLRQSGAAVNMAILGKELSVLSCRDGYPPAAALRALAQAGGRAAAAEAQAFLQSIGPGEQLLVLGEPPREIRSIMAARTESIDWLGDCNDKA